jgi:hypothetical protein
LRPRVPFDRSGDRRLIRAVFSTAARNFYKACISSKKNYKNIAIIFFSIAQLAWATSSASPAAQR